ncbi:hypothetical protein BDW62DRAFT_204547 [Aspergillus aurantiobrunneus]
MAYTTVGGTCDTAAMASCYMRHSDQIQSQFISRSNRKPGSSAEGTTREQSADPGSDGVDPFFFSPFANDPLPPSDSALWDGPRRSSTKAGPSNQDNQSSISQSETSEYDSPPASLYMSFPPVEEEGGIWSRVLNAIGFQEIAHDIDAAAHVLRVMRDEIRVELEQDIALIARTDLIKAQALESASRAMNDLAEAELELRDVENEGVDASDEARLRDIVTQLTAQFQQRSGRLAELDVESRKLKQELQFKQNLHEYLEERYAEA